MPPWRQSAVAWKTAWPFHFWSTTQAEVDRTGPAGSYQAQVGQGHFYRLSPIQEVCAGKVGLRYAQPLPA